MGPVTHGIPAFEFDKPNSYFMGLPMQQSRLAVPAWSYFFERYEEVATIVEIGTGEGGFTTVLALAAATYGFKVITVDLKPLGKNHWLRRNGLPVEIWQTDALTDKLFHAEVEYLRDSRVGTMLILCDGGDKPAEFELYANFLRPGDVIAAHDFAGAGDNWAWHEISHATVNRVADTHNLKPFYPTLFEKTGWVVRRKTRA